MTTPCQQTETISNLKANQTLFMEILKEVKDDVKDIKKYLFEWWLEWNYAKKSSVDRIWIIIRSIIWFFFTALWTTLVVLFTSK